MDKKKTDKIDADGPMTMDTIKDLIKQSVTTNSPNLPKEDKKEHAKVLMKMSKEGLSPKEAMKIPDQEISRIYGYAYYLFSKEKYVEAKELFKLLVMMDPTSSDFATALGACFHRLKEFESALQFYMFSAFIAPKDPVPMYYAYDCFYNMNNKPGAGMMLCNVISKAGDDPKYAKIKERAKTLLTALEKEIADEEAKEAKE